MAVAESFQRGAVVVGVDGTDKDLPVLDWAVDEAQLRRSGLHVVFASHWFPALSYGDVPVDDLRLRKAAERIVQAAVDHARARSAEVPLTSAVVREDPAAALVGASGRADLVVMGAQRLGRIAGRLVGSVSQNVSAHAHAPVVVVRGAASVAEGPVVIGIDAAEGAADVFRFAFGEAVQRGLAVRVVHAELCPDLRLELQAHRVHELAESVWEERATDVQRVAEEWSLRYPGVPLDVRMVRRHPVEALVYQSGDASMLVVGRATHHGPTDPGLSSVTRGVLHELPVVAVVPHRHGSGSARARSAPAGRRR